MLFITVNTFILTWDLALKLDVLYKWDLVGHFFIYGTENYKVCEI